MLRINKVTDISGHSLLYRLRLNYSGTWRGKECYGIALLERNGGLATEDDAKTNHLLKLLRRFNTANIQVDDQSI